MLHVALQNLVGGIGLEPTTSAMSTQCSNQLSYPPERTNYTRTYEKGQAAKGI